MRVHCRACGRPVDAADVNLDRLIAKCRACHAVFGVELDGAPAAPRPRAPVPMPPNMSLDLAAPGLRIVRRWFAPGFLFLLFFCVAWDGFLVFWYWMAGTIEDELAWIMLVFPIVHVAVGVALTWFTIAGFLNRTSIEVDRGILSVRHHPLWWPGNRSIPVDDVEQVYCVAHGRRSEHHALSVYDLCLTAAGRKIRLLSGVPELEQALFLEQRIEEHLGIEDRRVPGEMAK